MRSLAPCIVGKILKRVVAVMFDKSRSDFTSIDLDFVKNNVFGITDIKRGNRLNEILEKYEQGEKDFFVVQSTQQKGKAVIVNIDVFAELLRAKEQLDALYDAHMDEVMLARKDDQARITLKEALKDEDLDFDEILSMANEFDEATD